jgi:hypothetical protein
MKPDSLGTQKHLRAGAPATRHSHASRTRLLTGSAIALGGAAVLLSDLLHALPALA